MDARDYIEEIDLQRYWLVLRRRWFPGALVFFSTVMMAGGYAWTRPPLYRAAGRLMFQQSAATTSLTGVGGGLGQLDTISVQNNPLDTQAVVLRSDALLERLIERLNLRDSSGQLVSTQAIKQGIEVSVVPGTDILTIAYSDQTADLPAALVNELMAVYIEYDIFSNRSEAAAAREFLEQELPTAAAAVEEAAEDLRRFKDQNNIIELQQEAAMAVDTLSNLDNQINQVGVELATLGTRSQELIQQLGMGRQEAVNLNTLTQTPGVQQALAQLQDLQAELSTEQSRYTSNHPIIENLRRQEAAAYGLLQERVFQVLNQNIEVAPSRLQMGQLQQDITASLVENEIERLSLATRLGSLREQQDQYLAWSNTFPDLEKRQRDLDNRLKAAQSTYDTLLMRRQEIQLAENQTVGNARILDQAITPKHSVATGRRKYILAGGMVGIPLAIAVAFLLDLIDRSLKTVKDAEMLFGYPLLGLIPRYQLTAKEEKFNLEADFMEAFSSEPSDLAAPLLTLTTGQYPIVADAYQMLQANLKFVNPDQRPKTFVITSTVNGEGKSSVAAHLALTLSQAGRQVLLVDGDLRSAEQHHLWQVVNGIGLSHVLVGEGHLQDALKPLAPNLTLLTAGVTPPNPLALLDSERMVTLLQELRDQFDYVVIDTPPLLGAAEAAILGNLVDGMLMVVRPRQVDSPSALAAKTMLERSGAKVLGLIANAVNLHIEHDDYVSQFKVAGQYGSVSRREPKLVSR